MSRFFCPGRGHTTPGDSSRKFTMMRDAAATARTSFQSPVACRIWRTTLTGSHKTVTCSKFTTVKEEQIRAQGARSISDLRPSRTLPSRAPDVQVRSPTGGQVHIFPAPFFTHGPCIGHLSTFAAMATSLNPLSASAIVIRRVHDTNLAEEIPVPPSDFHSNDYLSLTTNPRLRDAFLRRPIQGPATLGSGSRVHATDNVQHSHAAFEERMRDFFHADAALLFPSSHDATLAFWHSVPKDGDAVIFDELVNKSIRAGIAASPCRERQYAFRHSSVASLRESIARVLRDQPSIAAGQSTLFLAVESLYSMDGDLAPLRDIVQTIEQLVPKGAAHIVVDEAHTTGLLGRDGRGLVSALGLEKRVNSVLHAFSKAWGLSGGISVGLFV